MKRQKRRLAAALAALALLVCGAYALSSDDSLISLSYLTGTFLPQAEKQGEQAGLDKLQETYDAAQKQLDEAQQAITGQAGLYSRSLEGREWTDGSVLTLPTGSGFILLEGTARLDYSGAVVDVTAGDEAASGGRLAKNHRYLVGEETQARITVLSGRARIGVQGSYDYTSGKPGAAPFYDVCQTDWYYEAVNYVYGRELFSGTGEGEFSPGIAMNRAMLMTVLYRLAGSPEQEMAGAQITFTDVPDSKWYAPYVRWGASRDITAGTGDGAFSPEVQINREQTVVLLYSFCSKYLGRTVEERADLSGYQDLSQVSSWARDAFSWAVARGIVSSTSAGQLTLSPQKNASRAEVAAMLRSFAQTVL